MARNGYSILELMIALALLGVLLAMSWSLLDTYRKAEERSWAVVQRMQAVRITTSWLESDMLHVVVEKEAIDSARSSESFASNSARDKLQSPDSLTGNNRGMVHAKFVGTATGFSAVVIPPLNPLPIMERLFESGEDPLDSQSDLASNMPFDSRNIDHGQPIRRPVSLERLEIIYELIATGQATERSQQAITVYDLIRRERIEQSQLTEEPDSSSHTSSEPVLTSRDLYRVADEPESIEGVILQENSVHGLANASFWYYNGTTWVGSWNSASSKMPLAVALVFNYPPRSGIQPIEPLNDLSNSPSDLAVTNSRQASDWKLADEPILESFGENFELLQTDVKLVFQLPPSTINNSFSRVSDSPKASRGLTP